MSVRSEADLAAVCVALGARDVPGWSREEQALVGAQREPEGGMVDAFRASIRAGGDPLGNSFCILRSSVERRARGATYTPEVIVRSMVDWVRSSANAARVIDPGAGSGRFLVAAGRAFSRARLLGIEIDPLAALMCRANLAVAGFARRAEVRVADYRSAEIQEIPGSTLFIGNPPYVRHHDIGPEWKEWLSSTARAHGLAASQLAGLHVHFFLATLGYARPGDLGVFVTAAEWLDVNYGQLVRDLLAGPLGLVRLDIVDPQAQAFEDALTTAAITSFRVGDRSATVHLRRVASATQLRALSGGRKISRSSLREGARWTHLSRSPRGKADGLVELGELCTVHRGQVTGSNDVWIAASDAPRLPDRFLFPAVTKAKELFAAGTTLASSQTLRRVIDLPADLDRLGDEDRYLVEQFLRWARNKKAHRSYIACHRSPWWSVKLRQPAPILATYMARRPPAFVRNAVGARHINIAHGVYPREPLPDACLLALAEHLRTTVSLAEGRMYAGGLTKFEPKEMERLLVPTVDVLRQNTVDLRAA